MAQVRTILADTGVAVNLVDTEGVTTTTARTTVTLVDVRLAEKSLVAWLTATAFVETLAVDARTTYAKDLRTLGIEARTGVVPRGTVVTRPVLVTDASPELVTRVVTGTGVCVVARQYCYSSRLISNSGVLFSCSSRLISFSSRLTICSSRLITYSRLLISYSGLTFN